MAFNIARFVQPAERSPEERQELNRALQGHRVAVKVALKTNDLIIEKGLPLIIAGIFLTPMIRERTLLLDGPSILVGLFLSLMTAYAVSSIQDANHRIIIKESKILSNLKAEYLKRCKPLPLKEERSFETLSADPLNIDTKQLFYLDDDNRNKKFLLAAAVLDEPLLQRRLDYLGKTSGDTFHIEVPLQERSSDLPFKTIYVAKTKSQHEEAIRIIKKAISDRSRSVSVSRRVSAPSAAQQEEVKGERKEKRRDKGEKLETKVDEEEKPVEVVSTLYYPPNFQKELKDIPEVHSRAIKDALERIRQGEGKPVAGGEFLEIYAGANKHFRIFFKKLSAEKIAILSIREKQKQDRTIENLKSKVRQLDETEFVSEKVRPLEI